MTQHCSPFAESPPAFPSTKKSSRISASCLPFPADPGSSRILGHPGFQEWLWWLLLGLCQGAIPGKMKSRGPAALPVPPGIWEIPARGTLTERFPSSWKTLKTQEINKKIQGIQEFCSFGRCQPGERSQRDFPALKSIKQKPKSWEINKNPGNTRARAGRDQPGLA